MQLNGVDSMIKVPMLKRQIFLVKVYGVSADDYPIVLRIEAHTTAKEVVAMVSKTRYFFNNNLHWCLSCGRLLQIETIHMCFWESG